jgi:dTDP-4-dehydrorhamnose reductase
VHGVVYDDHGTPSIMTQNPPDSHIRPVLITGGGGTLGRAFARGCVLRGIPHRVLIRSEADIADADSVRRAIARHRPWAIINTAGYVRVDDAEQDRDACFRENTLGPRILAQECERKNIRLVTFSSDLIFNGSKFAQYIEPDSPAPLNVYGESNFVYAALKACVENRRFRAAADVTVSPTYVPDLVNCSLDLLIDEEQGVWHVANVGVLTWADLAERSALLAGLNLSLIERCETRDLNLPARRPLFSALASCRSQSMPPIDDALRRFMLARSA